MGATNLYNEYMKKKSVLPTANTNSVLSTNSNNLDLKTQIVNNNTNKNIPTQQSATSTSTLGQVNPNSISGVNTPTNANPNLRIVPTASNTPSIASAGAMARKSSPTSSKVTVTVGKGKTNVEKYNGILQQILQEQQEQAKKDYESSKNSITTEYNNSKNELQTNYDNTKKEYEFAKNEANKNFNTSKEELADTLYKQQEATNIDGANRGIQYSPQMLGLKNVNSINHNKNLTKLINEKNTLLSEIDMKIANLTNSLNTSLGNLQNSYNADLSELENTHLGSLSSGNQQYLSSLLDLMLSDSGNASSGSSYSGKSYGYNSYKGYNSNYKPYTYKSYSGSKTRSANGYDNSNDYVNGAGLLELKKVSSDVFNDIVKGGAINLNNVDDVTAQYDEVMSEYLDSLEGMPQEYIDEAMATMKVTRQQLLNKAYSNSTNTPYIDSNLVAHLPQTPLRRSAILNNRIEGDIRKAVAEENASGNFKAKTLNNANNVHQKIVQEARKKNDIKQKQINKKVNSDVKKLNKKGDSASKFKAKTISNANSIHNKIVSEAKKNGKTIYVNKSKTTKKQSQASKVKAKRKSVINNVVNGTKKFFNNIKKNISKKFK